MIKKLTVKNFKSLRDVKLNCARVNIFIGRPNAGKSNILEVIGLLSSGYHGSLWDFVRAGGPFDLFFGKNLEGTADIEFDKSTVSVKPHANGVTAWWAREAKLNAGETILEQLFDYSFSGASRGAKGFFEKYKFYRFGAHGGQDNLKYLSPPGGGNLALLVYTNTELRKLLQSIFSEYGLRLSVERDDSGGRQTLRILQDSPDLPVTYSWQMVSQTLQRIVFYLAAIVTNKDSVLAFEEPEAHAFPYYTKFLAERIAMDESNQYFLTTHNPYFLMSLLEKTPKKELACFVIDMRNYETVVKKLTQRQISEVMDETSNVFFSIDKYFGDKE